ncbi:flagellar hook-length control protein FliK [Exiguobacterium sp. Helios]|uniref:flagellar hook-length control protein FliK n=1 Tax=Exiguobacterium sp. Helios TaxID=2735868 RepID=UPI00165E3500|nr:flagellar hook-length control protein FliK [Exiguobacterium sp. Helios]QNR21468.1 flagellar hook-length control protein FliK [Exiguobacterium sp. Helios]
MNLTTDVQQAQTAKPVTKWNGKELPANGVGNFASLLQYLVQPLAEGVQNPSLDQQTIPTEVETNLEVKPLLEQLTAQPEKVLKLLEQPEVEGMIHDPKKATELIQFIKLIQDGQQGQAMELFEQFPVSVQQVLAAAVSTVIGVDKENVKSNELPVGMNTPVIRMTDTPGIALSTPPVSNPTLVDSTGIKKDAVVTPFSNRLVLPEQNTPTLKTSVMTKKVIESIQIAADPEGKDQPSALTGLKFERMNSALGVGVRPSVMQPSVDDQLTSRIEAAMKQAPFLKGADGSTRMSIRLYPEQLGEVVIQLDKKDGLLTVKLFAATEQAKQMLDQQLGKLHTSLQPQAPFVKVETGMLASSVKDFEQGLPQERRERQQEEPAPYEEELEEDEDD